MKPLCFASTLLALVAPLVARTVFAQVDPTRYPTPDIDLALNLGAGEGSGGQTGGTPTPTPLPCSCTPGGDFELRHLDSTAIQIAVTWEKVPEASGYTVLRCDQGLSAQVPASVNAYGDTGLASNKTERFATGVTRQTEDGVNYLNPGQTYTYQIRAQIPFQSDQLSNCLKNVQLLPKDASRPRGKEGDLWADLVFGKPDAVDGVGGQNGGSFAELGFGQLSNKRTGIAGGVLVDRSTQPARVYVGDVTNNRILGFDHIGECENQTCNPSAGST